MDQAAAHTLLKELLCCLPIGWWCLVHQKTGNDLGLAKAFGRPLAEINALLVNAGICKETGQGTSFVKRGWETFITSKVSDPLQLGTKGRVHYVANSSTIYNTPSAQMKENARGAPSVQLPDRLVQSLRESAKHYDRKNADSSKQQKEATRLEKIQADAVAKREREALAKSLQYPISSKVVDADEAISLRNEKIREWARQAMSEIVRLHEDAGLVISCPASNGKEMSYLQVPCSNDSASFIVNDSTTKWISKGIKMSIGNGMSLSDGIGCVRQRLDAYHQKPISDQDTSSESDEEHMVSATLYLISMSKY